MSMSYTFQVRLLSLKITFEIPVTCSIPWLTVGSRRLAIPHKAKARTCVVKRQDRSGRKTLSAKRALRQHPPATSGTFQDVLHREQIYAVIPEKLNLQTNSDAGVVHVECILVELNHILPKHP